MQKIEEENRDPEKVPEDKKGHEVRKRVVNISGRIIALLGILCVIGGLAVIIYQFYYWLKIGKWLSMPFSAILLKVISLDFLHQLQWKGISKLLIWFTNQSSALVLIILGSIIAIIGDIMYVLVTRDYKESHWRK
jgi:hypothetical protein